MKILKLFFAIFAFGILLSSCSKEENLNIEKQIKANELLMNYGLTESSTILDYALSNSARSLNLVENYENVQSRFKIEPSLSYDNLLFWISKLEDANSFSELVQMAKDLNIVSENQLNLLTDYDKLVFSEISEEEIISNIEGLSTQISNSNELTSLEKEQLLKLNSSIIYGLTYSQAGIAQSRASWGCVAGIAVTFTSGFLTPNPLGVIAGAMMVDKYC